MQGAISSGAVSRACIAVTRQVSVALASQRVQCVRPDIDVAEVLLARTVEVGATVAREGIEFGVLARGVAVGGQLLTLKGLAGEYTDVFLPLFGEHQAHNAAVARTTSRRLEAE